MIKVVGLVNGASAKRFPRLLKTVAIAASVSLLPSAAFAATPHSSPATIAVAQANAGQGGPFEAARASFDPKFKALFLSWQQLDPVKPGMVSIPSAKPILTIRANFTSGYGTRSDPFKTVKAMHAGIDLAGPIGTPIYATADGMVGRAGVAGGYGNLVELEHGKAIQTRFGHLSAILVHIGQRVKRGDMIGRMGSTGRSTGSHLHYEVRVDGAAVNPLPFLASADYVLAAQQHGASTQVAMGGPEN